MVRHVKFGRLVRNFSAISSRSVQPSSVMKFSASHAQNASWRDDGLRSCFEYRDLGIVESTGGKAMAHVIRAKPGVAGGFKWHKHNCDFQMYYVLKGWIEFEYEGIGLVRSTAGSCVHQPPGIVHRSVANSDDLELLEIVIPGDFKTEDIP